MANKNTSLNDARVKKNDEYYTQISDIDAELKHYKKEFKDKTVYCNCDNPYKSNFVKYFLSHFEEFNLKRLIATNYAEKELFEPSNDEAWKLDVSKDDLNNVDKSITPLKGDGDFRSQECLSLLEESDIIVTNPPFSLFREYIAQLIEYNKKFLVVGSMNAITTADIFPLIKNDTIRIGYKSFNRGMSFIYPPETFDASKASIYSIDEATGNYLVTVMGIIWFTNLNRIQNHKKINLTYKYNPTDYPQYDNYTAIEVSRVKKIPYDYTGLMGVPISFLDKYNPNQFEIIGCSASGMVDDKYKLPHWRKHNSPYIKGKGIYQRIFIVNKEPRE